MRSPYSQEKLAQIMEQNRLVTQLLSRYLNYNPRFLDAKTVSELAADCEIDEGEAFRILLCAASGLDTAENRAHRQLEKQYFIPGFHLLNTKEYTENPYYKSIQIPQIKRGRWELRQAFYAPFEPFVCGHPQITDGLREIPQIGFFKETFSFPAVLEDGVEWMTVTPNEIETMKEPIREAFGSVLTLGLGLGYYAFMVSEKEEVTSVTVVEKDADVIALFRELILPQFPHKEKISIVHDDAFAYLKNGAKKEGFDYIFADLWHDQSDGLDLYLRLRKLEKEFPHTRFSYWIEPTLLSSLRHMVYAKLTEKNSAIRLEGISPEELLSDAFLKKLALDLKKIE